MLHFKRVFHTDDTTSPYEQITWTERTAEIKDDTGKVIFRQEGVKAPAAWSDLAVNVAVSKYFYGRKDSPNRETGIDKLIHRVCRTIADWGVQDGYFGAADGEVFYTELSTLCLQQYASFNSPVWFNVGLWHQYKIGNTGSAGNWWWNPVTGHAEEQTNQYEHPQCSACFIQHVEDNMPSIMSLAVSEARLFKFGSGSGTNLSSIRSKREFMSGGGRPSGPLSFLRIYDQVCNVVKSGGKTRRAAKMNILDDWHGDIEEFIDAKQLEEKKAWALIEQGYSGDYNGEAYSSIMYQNENLSVRLSDEFMRKALGLTDKGESEWVTRAVTTGKPLEKKDARVLFRKIAEGTWLCGDPGVQFDSTIQHWHTCKKSGRIEATNPCSEYVFLDDTACNLASLNLMKFRQDNGGFDVEKFKAAIRLLIVAQDIIVDNASYPTERIAERSHEFRTLGLGYANLGALLMVNGLPYDSDGGRRLASAITDLMTAYAYKVSAELAQTVGAFPAYAENRTSFAQVIEHHCQAHGQLSVDLSTNLIDGAAEAAWISVKEATMASGFRNAQVTLLAPTGTISFMMDCATTGVEPDIALVKYKLLAGGGNFKMVNPMVTSALRSLGYSADVCKGIVAHIEATGTIEGSVLKPEHLAVFDCALKPAAGKRVISYEAHIRMMAAVQPFISGAISKTVNMPFEATVDDIAKTYAQAWNLGLKCVAIYRDGSKRSQPVTTKKGDAGETGQVPGLKAEIEALKAKLGSPRRKKMPATRQSVTHKFSIAGHEGYLTVGLFPDGKPGELFITMSKEGSTVGGLMDCVGTLTSMALQYGVPLDTLVAKFSHVRFEPSGFTTDSQIRSASSIIDYVFRWLDSQFAVKEEPKEKPKKEEPKEKPAETALIEMHVDAPPCPNCGHITVRNGSCHKCLNCGESLGCS